MIPSFFFILIRDCRSWSLVLLHYCVGVWAGWGTRLLLWCRAPTTSPTSRSGRRRRLMRFSWVLLASASISWWFVWVFFSWFCFSFFVSVASNLISGDLVFFFIGAGWIECDCFDSGGNYLRKDWILTRHFCFSVRLCCELCCKMVCVLFYGIAVDNIGSWSLHQFVAC